MPELNGRLVSVLEVNELYREKENEWFLLDVVKTNRNGKAEQLKILKHSPEKDELRDYLLELSNEVKNRYIFFFSEPDRKCEI